MLGLVPVRGDVRESTAMEAERLALAGADVDDRPEDDRVITGLDDPFDVAVEVGQRAGYDGHAVPSGDAPRPCRGSR